MRLSTKISLGLLMVILLVVGIDSFVTLRAELDEIDQESHRDATVLAIALRSVVESAEAHEGHARAVQLVQEVNATDPHLSAHIVPQDAAETSDDHRLVATVPLQGQPEMVLEVVRSTHVRDAHVQRTIRQTIVTGLILTALAGLVTIFLGSWLVGRPLEQLIRAARAIASGEPHTPIELNTGDELGDLAAEMNAMSKAIGEARARTAAETAQKLRAVEQLRHAERLAVLGRMAAGVAHELGTPLNVIAGRAEMIVKADEGDGATRNAIVIRRQTRRISKIIRQLLDFARRRPVEREAMSIATLVSSVVESIQTVARSAKVHVVGTTPAIEVDGDPTQLAQVLTNLMINAIDAGAGNVAVSYGLVDADLVRIRVVDDGSGIHPDVRDKIFDPFFTTKDVGEGTGLGLSVSLGIVEEHGGWLDVESEPDGGTRVDIHLRRRA